MTIAFYDQDGLITFAEHLSKPFKPLAKGPVKDLKRFLGQYCTSHRGRHLHVPNNDPEYFKTFLKGLTPPGIDLL